VLKDGERISFYFGIQKNERKFCFSIAKEDCRSISLGNGKTNYKSKMWKGKYRYLNQKKSFGFLETLELIKIGKYFIKKNSKLYIEKKLGERNIKLGVRRIIKFGLREKKSQLAIIDLRSMKKKNHLIKKRERLSASVIKKLDMTGLSKNIQILEKQRMCGKILFWNYIKRYGWIIRIRESCNIDFEEELIYLKYKDVEDDNLYLQEGTTVQFILFQNEYGLGALHVARANIFCKNMILVNNAKSRLEKIYFKLPLLQKIENKSTIHLIINSTYVKSLKRRSNSIMTTLKEATQVNVVINYNNFRYFQYSTQTLVTLTGDFEGIRIVCQLLIEIISEISQSTRIEIVIKFRETILKFNSIYYM